MAEDEQATDPTIEQDIAASLDDRDENDATADYELSPVVEHVKASFLKSETRRRQDEDRWLKAYRNYRGIYGPDTMFLDAEKSRVFVKVTKTKVLAAYGQIIDVLFASSKFPLTIQPTPLPEDIEESAHFNADPNAPKLPDEESDKPTPSPYGYPGDGNDLEPGAVSYKLKDRLGPLAKKFGDIIGLKSGEGQLPTDVTIHPAAKAAKKMEKQIHDQLEESGSSKSLRLTAFECSMLGSGVMGGPFAEDKEYPKWDEEGKYTPVFKSVPRVENCSVWDAYPDPDANTMDDASFFIRRRKMSRTKLRRLMKRPYFRKNAIETAIKYGPNYEKKHWEDDIQDFKDQTLIDRWEVLEFWGFMDADDAENEGIKLPEDVKPEGDIQVNAWICGNQIIRLVVNPFKPQRIPYYVVPYELNPYSIFGIGVAENMDDAQHLMNGFMRMAVDNAVLSGNLIIEIDETNLVPGQDTQVYPGKIFRRQGGAPGQAIFGTHYPNVSNENMQMFDKSRQLADESTGLPSYSHGQTGVSGIGRTAAGISMLMGASGIAIKTVVKNFDDFLIRPLGEACFAFNMQFNPDPDIKGDLEVKARGIDSLMATEVRSQRLMQFLQVTSNNQYAAPHAKFPYIISQIAESLSLDPEKVINSPEEAARQALLIGKMGGPQGTPADPTGAMDMSGGGGGNIGVGSAPTPNEPGFTGNMNAAP